MGRIIAYSGSHGTGKTTAAYELAAQLKKQTRADVGIILEVARRCPLSVFRKGHAPTEAAQIWIFSEQMRLEIEALQRHDLVVADRTVVDAIAYSAAAGFHDLARAQIATARRHVHVYDKVYFRGAADNPFLVDDGFRETDPDLQKTVESLMLELYSELGIGVIRDYADGARQAGHR